ncbi:hypothetical protein LWI29_000593 [Acer saccharum]|uniref:Uncharacterized protein n=1 Tax=Acer saccharum TaxID=4024 RepID=A0AA39SH82_ACESA|nr:hypothetical protein LWI29_000593 [Acer saccharum]
MLFDDDSNNEFQLLATTIIEEEEEEEMDNGVELHDVMVPFQATLLFNVIELWTSLLSTLPQFLNIRSAPSPISTLFLNSQHSICSYKYETFTHLWWLYTEESMRLSLLLKFEDALRSEHVRLKICTTRFCGRFNPYMLQYISF